MRWMVAIGCVVALSGAVGCRARTAGGKASDVQQVAGTAGGGDITLHGCVVRDQTGAWDLMTRENPGGVGGQPGAGEHASPPGTNPGEAGETHQYRLLPGQGIDLGKAQGKEVEIAGAPGAAGGQPGSAFEQETTGPTKGGGNVSGSANAAGSSGNSQVKGNRRTAVTGQAGGSSMGAQPVPTTVQTFSVDRLRVLADNCAATGMPPTPPGARRK